MATWKKVVVSGSNVGDLFNDAGYLTSATVGVPNSFSTASVNGTTIIADSAAGTLIYASSSGQGLTLLGTSAPDTITFGLSAIPNSSLANSSVLIGGQTITLGASATTTLTGLTSITATSITGSFTGSLTGDLIGTASYALSAPYSGLTGTPAGIVSSSVLTGPATQGQVLLTTNGVAGTTVTIQNLGTTGNPTFNNVIVSGDLTVSGTTTAINTANLYVADQFILIASGSANNSTDGGIIVDRGAYTDGNIAIAYDSATFRWGFQNGIADTVNTVDLGAASNGVNGAFLGTVFTEATHGAAKPTTGEFAVAGAIYTSTAGDIYMYS